MHVLYITVGGQIIGDTTHIYVYSLMCLTKWYRFKVTLSDIVTGIIMIFD